MTDHHIMDAEKGYFVAVGGDLDTIMATLPEGSFTVPPRPSPYHEWENGAWVDRYVPPTIEEVRAAMTPLSRRQFRLGMAAIGLTKANIDNQIAAMTDPEAREIAQIEWEEAAQFERTHPLVAQLSEPLGVTPEEIDALFEQYRTV